MKTTIVLPNGSTAIDFTPEDSRVKAIVHLSVIQRLAKLLPKAQPSTIIDTLIEELYQIRNNPAGEKLERAVAAAEEFTSFHQTVNLITAYDPNENMPDITSDHDERTHEPLH